MEEKIYFNPNELDDELNIDIKKIIMSIWSRKWLMIKVGFCIFTIVLLSSFVMPKKYEVDSDLYINKTNNSNMAEINPYFISEVGTGSGMAAMLSGGGGNLLNEIELMESPLVMDKVIQENDIRVKKFLGIIKTKKYGQYVKTEKFIKKINIENKKGTNVVTISFKSKDKELAYGVVSSIIKNYTQLHKELNTEKSKSDKAVLQAEYNSAKTSLNKKMSSVSGLPQSAVSGAGGIAALSAISKSASRAMSSIQGQYASGVKSEIALREESEKVAELAKKLEWAKLVDNMSDSSNVVILKEPQHLKDYEQTSPKLLINILLGIVFGVIGAFVAVIVAELLDKKLAYSMLGDEVIYDIQKDFSDLKLVLLSNQNKKIALVLFENLPTNIIEQFKDFDNLSAVQAELSKEFIKQIENNSVIVLFASIGKTDSKTYKQIKQILANMDKKVVKEVLV